VCDMLRAGTGQGRNPLYLSFELRIFYLVGSKNRNSAKAAVFQLFWFWTGVAQQACRGRLSKDNRRQGVPGAADQCNNFDAPWQCLNFLPEPQGHRSLRPGTGTL
jgi:hypothetical protein